MRDPFRPNSNAQLFREAQAGLSLIAILLILFVYVAYYRISGVGRTVPEHVRRAPVAETVWPQYMANPAEVRVAGVKRSAAPNPRGDQGSAAMSPRQPKFQSPSPAPNHFIPQAADIAGNAPPTNSFEPNRLRNSEVVGAGNRSPSSFAPPNGRRAETSPIVTSPIATEPIAPQPLSLKPIASQPPVTKPLLLEPTLARNERDKNQPVNDPFQMQVASARPATFDAPPTEMAFDPIPPSPLRSSQPRLDSPKPVQAIDDSLHVVTKGDSFWSIAQARYGDGQFFRALYEHNRHQVAEFERLKNGQRIETPSSESLIERYPELCPGEHHRNIRLVTAVEEIHDVTNDHPSNRADYLTAAGDTLFEIAGQQLGQASRYLEILELNAGVLPPSVDHQTRLPGGLQLQLP